MFRVWGKGSYQDAIIRVCRASGSGLGFEAQGLTWQLGGSWVVISGVISRVAHGFRMIGARIPYTLP